MFSSYVFMCATIERSRPVGPVVYDAVDGCNGRFVPVVALETELNEMVFSTILAIYPVLADYYDGDSESRELGWKNRPGFRPDLAPPRYAAFARLEPAARAPGRYQQPHKLKPNIPTSVRPNYLADSTNLMVITQRASRGLPLWNRFTDRLDPHFSHSYESVRLLWRRFRRW